MQAGIAASLLCQIPGSALPIRACRAPPAVWDRFVPLLLMQSPHLACRVVTSESLPSSDEPKNHLDASTADDEPTLPESRGGGRHSLAEEPAARGGSFRPLPDCLLVLAWVGESDSADF